MKFVLEADIGTCVRGNAADPLNWDGSCGRAGNLHYYELKQTTVPLSSTRIIAKSVAGASQRLPAREHVAAEDVGAGGHDEPLIVA
jgi:hypothetical protein